MSGWLVIGLRHRKIRRSDVALPRTVIVGAHCLLLEDRWDWSCDLALYGAAYHGPTGHDSGFVTRLQTATITLLLDSLGPEAHDHLIAVRPEIGEPTVWRIPSPAFMHIK